MIERSFNEITGLDIQRLLDESIPESRTLDYKESINCNSEDEKSEFLRDLSSFANSLGGDLIYGVSELRAHDGKPTGVPNEIVGINSAEADGLILRLESIARTGIDPRLPELHLRAIAIDETRSVILIRVGESWFKPHQVAYRASNRFFIRTSSGKMPLDFQEVKDLILRAEEVPKRIRSFRDERLATILSGDLLFPIKEMTPIVCLHVLPLSAFTRKHEIDFSLFTSHKLQFPLASGIGGMCRMNLDGFARYELTPGAKFLSGLVQLFRSGAMEYVDPVTIHFNPDSSQQVLSAFEVETRFLSWIKSAFNVLKRVGFEGRCYCFGALLNISGYYLGSEQHLVRGFPYKVDRKHLILPEIEADLDNECNAIVKPMFDTLWQSFGLNKSPYFDEYGNSTLRTY